MKNITRRNALILGLLSATISACSLRPFSGSRDRQDGADKIDARVLQTIQQMQAEFPETLELKNNDHIPLNNDILILCVSRKDSHILEKLINDD